MTFRAFLAPNAPTDLQMDVPQITHDNNDINAPNQLNAPNVDYHCNLLSRYAKKSLPNLWFIRP